MERQHAPVPPPVIYKSQGIVRDIPLAPHEMVSAITPASKLFMLAHLSVIQAASEEKWRIEVAGLVERPLSLTLGELARFPAARIEAVHQCAGSPLAPTVPTRRVACVLWEGVRLRDLLEEAGVRSEARFIWSDGADGGTFEGVEVPFYRKDLPLARLDGDVLLATKLNGEPLPSRHGGPVRLVVPGFFGTNSTKWLWRLTLADRRADGLFTTRYYNDVSEEGGTRPVWALAPESIIVSPAPGAAVTDPVELRGWAWADEPITTVEVSTDDGTSWHGAVVEPRRNRAWQAWRHTWSPATAGPAALLCRAIDAIGQTQPLAGARNAVHRIEVVVERSGWL